MTYCLLIVANRKCHTNVLVWNIGDTVGCNTKSRWIQLRCYDSGDLETDRMLEERLTAVPVRHTSKHVTGLHRTVCNVAS